VIRGERHAVGRRRHPGCCQRDAVNGQLTAGMRERKNRIARDERWWRKVNRGSGEVNRGSRRVNRGSGEVNRGSRRVNRGSRRVNGGSRRVSRGSRRVNRGSSAVNLGHGSSERGCLRRDALAGRCISGEGDLHRARAALNRASCGCAREGRGAISSLSPLYLVIAAGGDLLPNSFVGRPRLTLA
jgi:hypothetical protein